MNGRLIATVAAIALLAAAIAAFVQRQALLDAMPVAMRDALAGWRHGFRLQRDLRIPMPDGVTLAANLYRPRSHDRPLGTILIRLPYDKDTYAEALTSAEFFAARGFAVLTQDVRGKFKSGGVYTPLQGDDVDGAATLDWITRQPWSNGKVGTFGCSALGETQIVLAAARHPAHAAAIAQADGGALGVVEGRLDPFGWFEGGIFNLASGFGWFLDHGAKQPGTATGPRPGLDRAGALWSLPTIDLVRRHTPAQTDYERFLALPFSDPSWQTSSFVGLSTPVSTPLLQINSWHDQAIDQTLALSALWRASAPGRPPASPSHLIVAPGPHCAFHSVAQFGRSGDMPIGQAAALPYWDWYLQWFRHWLGDGSTPLPTLPRYLLYVTGEDRWVQSDHWPLEQTRSQSWYLAADGPANSSGGGGRLLEQAPAATGADRFDADPARPVPTVGGPFCCTGIDALRGGSVDQAEVERRDDVLVYTSAPLSGGLRLLGPLRAVLHVSSSAPDADLVAKLVDVAPDGTALNIQEGALRLRFRNGWQRPALLVPGQVYRVEVQMRAVGHLLRPGHRLRLQIAGSSFPRLERNLHTGGSNHDERQGVVATTTLHHGGPTASALIVSVVDAPVYYPAAGSAAGASPGR